MNGPLVVIGDALLDVDLVGTAERLAPDAPVPVLDDLVEQSSPGGAGLAATMAARDGHEVVLVTALGDDEAGERVERLLQSGVKVMRLPYDGPTPVRQRVRAGGQSLVRLDSGNRAGTVGPLSRGVRTVIDDAGAVLVADYGHGVTGVPELRDELSDMHHRAHVTWDPHPRGAAPVPGARLVTPSESEAALFGGPDTGPGRSRSSGLAATAKQAATLVALWRAQAVAVTLGARGALLSYGQGTPVMTPAPFVQCVDSCGAGDRFAVSAALALGAGRITTDVMQDAVRDAAAYVAAGGPASLRQALDEPDQERHAASVADLVASVSARGGVVVATGGCFDLLHAGHVATLQAARRLGDCLVVCLNSDRSVRRVKGASRPLVPAVDRARVLDALECVDRVVMFDEDTPAEVLRSIRPHIWAKGGDYAGADVPEAATIQEWGGQAVALPYIEGRSTTQLVRTAAGQRKETTA
jgi:D-beta-D-heptose 7-phosphate kinase/D-beta-D-heptose 1-phosphate adenosyltransferase